MTYTTRYLLQLEYNVVVIFVFLRFDTTTERWESVADMRNARSALTMVAMDGKLYVFGKL